MTIDYNSPIGITAQTLAARLPDMSDDEIEYLYGVISLVRGEKLGGELGTELVTNTPVVTNQSEELVTELVTNTPVVTNQSEELVTNPPVVTNQSLTNQNIPVPVGHVEYKPVPKNGKEYFYYCWRYYDRNGKKQGIHLGSDRGRALNKIQRIGIPSDARVNDR